MNLLRIKTLLIYVFSLIFMWELSATAAHLNAIELTEKSAENQLQHLIEPVLDKYCHDECKLLNEHVTIDIATPDQVAPGFDNTQPTVSQDLAPSSGQVTILIDDKVGPISRSKLVDLLQQYLDTLEYPVKIETKVTHFPLPIGSEGKIAELRDQATKKFTQTINDLIEKFCPQRCLLADYALQTEVVNGEEAQYGTQGEFLQDGDTAIKIKSVSGTILMDQSLSKEEQSNILEMAKLKTNYFKNVTLAGKSMKFPHPELYSDEGGGSGNRGPASFSRQNSSFSQQSANSNSKFSSNSKENSISSSKSQTDNNTTNNNNMEENNTRQEKFERIEKIERVENGDAVQAELQKFKIFGLIFACSIIALLVFIAMAAFRTPTSSSGMGTNVHRIIQNLASDSTSADPTASKSTGSEPTTSQERAFLLSKHYEIERLLEELTSIYAQQPKVAKQVFSRVLTEEGVEFTAKCIHLFGESIVVDMLRDPSLQTDLTELMEFYAKNPASLEEDEKLDILRKLHARTVAGKLVVLGNRSTTLFDFLAEMDGLQILELIRTESMTVKSIILTQCDPQKRTAIYAQLDPEVRMKLLTELSRIDYLPRDYIFNVANALKRKKKDNPKLNTEALPGSEVLVSLLERTGHSMQKTVIKTLEMSNPDSARTVKNKLVSIDTLKYLRDGQLLEVVLSLKHDELIQFLKGTPDDIRKTIFAKSPQELVLDLEDELGQMSSLSRESYQAVERKVLNRMKIMANEGQINLIETNERMFSEGASDAGFVQATPGVDPTASLKKVAGW